MADLDSRSSSPPSAHSTLRHELRTPLNQIIGYAQLLQEEASDAGQESLLADLQKIEAAGRRLCEIIDTVVLIPSIPPVSAIEIANLPQTPQASAEQGGAGFILVVDDNAMNRDMLSRRLAQRGFEVQDADGGESALEMVQKRLPDLILLDVMMPDISGLEVLTTLRKTYAASALPIIMVTAKDTADDVVRALGLGANDYLSKPVDFRVAMARIETQLSLKRSRDDAVRLHAQLAEAQDQVARLSDSSIGALDNAEAWASAAARDVCAVLRARALSVWLAKGESFTCLCGATSVMPEASTLRGMVRPPRMLEVDGGTVVPVVGMAGELFGALVVEGGVHVARVGARVLWTFARQLGAALELSRVKDELARMQSERPSSPELRREDGVRICPQCGACFDASLSECPHDGGKLRSAGGLPHRILERYRLDALLGEGGMSSVFLAFDERLARETALKVVRPELLYDQTVRSRSEQEARVVARIGHPGVVAIHDTGKLADGSVFLVMERLIGCDMGRLVARFGAGSPQQVATVVREAAAALHAAHAAGVVHRDMKPENLFLAADRNELRVKLLDFGLAREVTAESHLTQTGVLLGTPLYMSPEQVLGRALDTRADIFSFAAVVYFMLTGQAASNQPDFGGIMLDIVYGQPPSIAGVLPKGAEVVDPILSQALARDVDARPRDILLWSEDLAAALAKVPAAPGVQWPDRATILAYGRAAPPPPSLLAVE